MQVPVFGGTFTEDFIIAQGILLVDGWYLAQFDLLGQDGVGFQSQSVGREVGETQLEEKVKVAVPLFGI